MTGPEAAGAATAGAACIVGMDGRLSMAELGFCLCHEHIYNRLGVVVGDDDLDLSDEQAVAADLHHARRDGIRAMVEASTYDMRPDLGKIARLAGEASIRVIKTTGWYKSPAAESVGGRSVAQLAQRMIADHRTGFAGTRWLAGLLGESGLTGTYGTPVERCIAAATAIASNETGMGILLHTESWDNVQALIRLYADDAGVPRDRLLAGHARTSDPLAGQIELAESGITLGFDQVGHPARDTVEAIADRVAELRAAGVTRIALSSDVGRRSRLSCHGGSGYTGSLRALAAALADRGLPAEAIGDLLGGTIGRFALVEAPSGPR